MKRYWRLIRTILKQKEKLIKDFPFMVSLKNHRIFFLVIVIQPFLAYFILRVRGREFFGYNFQEGEGFVIFILGIFSSFIGVYIIYILLKAYKVHYNYIGVIEDSSKYLGYKHETNEISKKNLIDRLSNLIKSNKDVLEVSHVKIDFDLEVLKQLKDLSNGKSENIYAILLEFIQKKKEQSKAEVKLSQIESIELDKLYREIIKNAKNENFYSKEKIDFAGLHPAKISKKKESNLIINYLKPPLLWGNAKIIIRLKNEILLNQKATKSFKKTLTLPVANEKLIFEFELRTYASFLFKRFMILKKTIINEFPCNIHFDIASSSTIQDKTNQFGGFQLKIYKTTI